MNNDYSNPSNMSSTWSSAGQTSNPSTSTSFNSYTLHPKWGSHNSSQSSTPTNPSTLTTAFPPCMLHPHYFAILRYQHIYNPFSFHLIIKTFSFQ